MFAYQFDIRRLFADAVFAKVKNPLRQVRKQPCYCHQWPHQGKREVARRARQIAAGTLATN